MTVCFSDQDPMLDSNSVFLAGPTRRNSHYEKSYRKEIVRLYQDAGFDGIIYVPEIFEERAFDENEVEKQTRWEWNCLDAAGIILFWVPRKLLDMPAFTTNVEFGIYTEKKPKQVVLGYPKDAEKMRYLRLRYEEATGRRPCSSLKELIDESLSLLNQYLEEEGKNKKETLHKYNR